MHDCSERDFRKYLEWYSFKYGEGLGGYIAYSMCRDCILKSVFLIVVQEEWWIVSGFVHLPLKKVTVLDGVFAIADSYYIPILFLEVTGLIESMWSPVVDWREYREYGD